MTRVRRSVLVSRLTLVVAFALLASACFLPSRPFSLVAIRQIDGQVLITFGCGVLQTGSVTVELPDGDGWRIESVAERGVPLSFVAYGQTPVGFIEVSDPAPAWAGGRVFSRSVVESDGAFEFRGGVVSSTFGADDGKSGWAHKGGKDGAIFETSWEEYRDWATARAQGCREDTPEPIP